MIKAVIFDMDGVISDTQKFHSKGESELLKRYGINLTPEEITKKYSGVRTSEFFKELLDEKKAKYDIDKLMKEKMDRMIKLANDKVDAIPYSIDLINKLLENGFRLAVASASYSEYVKTVLEKLNVYDKFEVIISGNLVKRGKPDPESFLLVSDQLKILPENCMVIEDGRSGMIAAKNSGMKCIGLVPDKNKEYPTNILVESLREIDINMI